VDELGTRHQRQTNTEPGADRGETVIQVSGIGPFEVNYVNAADDPRNATKK